MHSPFYLEKLQKLIIENNNYILLFPIPFYCILYYIFGMDMDNNIHTKNIHN